MIQIKKNKINANGSNIFLYHQFLDFFKLNFITNIYQTHKTQDKTVD